MDGSNAASNTTVDAGYFDVRGATPVIPVNVQLDHVHTGRESSAYAPFGARPRQYSCRRRCRGP